MNKHVLILLPFFLYIHFADAQNDNKRGEVSVDQQIEDLLKKMTIEEKVGQLNFLVGESFNTGPTRRTTESDAFNDAIRSGSITGFFNIHGTEYIAKLQKVAVEESRLGIPLLIGADVIHGFKTVFPIPLGQAASWDLEAIERAESVAAAETAATGISLTFSPMVDVARDARWGRVAEGSGEDTYLGSLIGAARVRGFQGTNLADPATIAACVKHFAAYGAAESGRDYNTVDMSEILLRNVYLPPFKAAIDAGAATLMTSFNELNGIPVTANQFIMREILRGEWGFEGAVISDWQNIGEMENHGYAIDRAHAGALALAAGTDVDMMSEIYVNEVPELIKDSSLEEKFLDESVRRVLKLKFDLGLFDDPYLYCNAEREKAVVRSAENLKEAFEMAQKSIVLLKNADEILPLKKDIKNIAVIGPMGDNKEDMNGTWSFFGEAQHPVSILEGINKYAGKSKVVFAQGSDFHSSSDAKFEEAIAAANNADVVIMAIGEGAIMSGEGASRANIGLPDNQLELLKAIHKTGKPIVALISSGRPLELVWVDENIPAVLATWTLGSEAGNAIASVLFGEFNPAAKLPITFPRAVGQLPLYYNYKNTGRPYNATFTPAGPDRAYSSRYRDVSNAPLYPFGYGLSYTSFEYGELKISSGNLTPNDSIIVTLEVENTGKVAGEEIVQLYIRDLQGSITRPVKELKGFQKLSFNPGEVKTIAFVIKADDLAFWRADMTYGFEAGNFEVFVGTNSRDVKKGSFKLNL